jgi:hypothetical protein
MAAVMTMAAAAVMTMAAAAVMTGAVVAGAVVTATKADR